MATRPESDRHHAAQVALTIALAQAVRKVWPMIDVTDLKGTLPTFKQVVAALVQHYSAASASTARGYYETQRTAAGVTKPYRPQLIAAPPAEQVDRSVKWATEGLWTPDSLTDRTLLDTAQTKVDGAVSKLVLDTGRNEIVDATESDSVMVGWAREARPNACWFCAMLATRGAVYSSARAAGRVTASDALGMPDTKGFVNRYHDHCRCRVVPVFNAYEKQAHVREWTTLWNSSTAHVTGMEAKQRAFQEAYEGRTINRRGKRGQKNVQPAGFESLTRDQILQQMRILSDLKDSDYKREQMARLKRRLAQL